MKTKNPPSEFNGFDDYVELFASGIHTDSAGRTSGWTNADLDQMVANHSATNAAPIVIGHPKDDASSFAYGWVSELKRQGNVLLGKFSQVDPGFEQLVKDGKLKNRSVRILKNQNGCQLGHVGWLGATPPAVAGLQPVQFASASDAFDFSVALWQPTGIMTRMMRNMREFLIVQFGQDKADSVLSNFDIDELNRLSEQQYQEEQVEQQGNLLDTSFSTQQDHTMSVTQAELDKAKQQVVDAEAKSSDFAKKNLELAQQLKDTQGKARLIECNALVAEQLKRGVKPADLAGVAEFMMSLDQPETATFEFSVGSDGAKKTVGKFEFMQSLLKALPATVAAGTVDFTDPDAVPATDFAAPLGSVVDPEALKLHAQILAYQAKHNCTYQTAVAAVAS